MAKKKTATKTKKKATATKAESYSIFSVYNLLASKKPKWDELPDQCKKIFGDYMINRIFSMQDEDFIGYANSVQIDISRGATPIEIKYEYFRRLLPRCGSFPTYITSKLFVQNKEVEVLSEHLQMSKKEATDYISLFKEVHGEEEYRQAFIELLESQGKQPNEINEIMGAK